MITPSNEFRTGGPHKQDLTSHVGPIALAMFVSTHYAGEDVGMKFKAGEQWKKVFGPVFIYLNSASNNQKSALWQNAKSQMLKEIGSWLYNFPQSPDFPHSNQRGSVSGQLLVRDGGQNSMPAAHAQVGLAPPGNEGSWQYENKGYQFWSHADGEGNFWIKGVRPGNYNLFAWVPGTIGDYKYGPSINISSGSNIKLNNLVYEAPRAGPTVWEIGIADRVAAEFFIPNPNPSLVNHLYNGFDKFRALEHTIVGLGNTGCGIATQKYILAKTSCTLNAGNKAYQATTWQILFDIKTVNKAANYTLCLALASAHEAELHFGSTTLGGDDCSGRLTTAQLLLYEAKVLREVMQQIRVPARRLLFEKAKKTIFRVTKNLKDIQGPALAIVLERLKHSGAFQETFEVAKTISMGPSLKSGSKVGKSGSKVHEPDEHPPQHIS
ncbi:unnamed protein product [Camellia sinensis]